MPRTTPLSVFIADDSAPVAEMLHELISDPGRIAAIQKAMADQKLVIADGHHRYETALNFRNECRQRAGADANLRAAYEYVMMTFVNMNNSGLLVLPTHRVVHSLPSFSVENFQSESRNFFAVEEIVPAVADQCIRQVVAGTLQVGAALQH